MKLHRHEEEADFELNLASIIDCFTVLITFMLASASFISIGILDAGVAASASATAEKSTPPPVNYTLELYKDFKYVLKVKGKSNSTETIHGKDGAWDYASLEKQLVGLKAKWPEVGAITLEAQNDVQYKEVVLTMDRVRKTLPAVLLGGY